MTKGRLLGHIISEQGISIDPERIQSLLKIPPPGNKKELKSFRKINFVSKFITGFVEIVKPLNAMLKQNVKVEWTPKAKKSFKEIKRAITEVPVLVSPYYLKPFYIYSFTSEHSCASILTKKDDEGNEHPITFMTAPLKDVELWYHNIEKKAYALVRGVKKFWHYILCNKVFAIVPDLAVKTLLMQNELGEWRAKWVTLL